MRFDVPYESDAEGSEDNEGTEDSDDYADIGEEDCDGSSDTMDESDLDLDGETDTDIDEVKINDAVDASDGGKSCEDGGVKYVPPHMRVKLGDKDREKIARLQKQVQGLVNR